MANNSTPSQKTVLIVGGGVAGLSAAVHVIRKGWRPLILEGARFAGGRVRSFFAPDFDSILDNGQHVLANAYTATREYLRLIGSDAEMRFQNGFEARFHLPGGQHFDLKSTPLPPPLHFLWPLIRHRRKHQIPFSDFWKFWFRCWVKPERNLTNLTVRQWLKAGGVSNRLTNTLFEPLCLATLNTPVADASAALLKRTAQLSFFHSHAKSGLGIPRKWLGDILIEPAVSFIRNAGGNVQLFNPARKLLTEGDRLTMLETRNEMLNAEAVILALPPHRLAQLLQNSPDPRWQELKNRAEHFKFHVIMTVNIKLNRPIPGPFPKAFIQSPIQWLFPHPEQDGHSYSYAVVVSVADHWASMDKAEVLDAVTDELSRHQLLSASPDTQVLAYKIIKEKKATISQTPQTQQLRPSPATPFSNVALAGDWVQTGLPATIESAVLSGKQAAEMLCR